MDTWPADARVFSLPSHLQGKSPGNEVALIRFVFVSFSQISPIWREVPESRPCGAGPRTETDKRSGWTSQEVAILGADQKE